MNDQDKGQTFTELAKSWNLKKADTVSEEAVLDALALRVSRLLEREPEAFFGLMYRLDISEKRLQAALTGANPPEAVARLIWDRQCEKVRLRRQHTGEKGADPDLNW